MLAYYIDKQIQQQLKYSQKVITFNLTLISQVSNNPINIDNRIITKQNLTQINKKIYNFCGFEGQFMRLIQNTNFKYNIKQYEIYFGEMVQGIDRNEFQINNKQSSFLNTFSQYGLSNYAANNFFKEFSMNNYKKRQQKQKKLYKLQEMTVSNVIKRSFPGHVSQNGLSYFSQKLGLDLNYIHSFIYPVVWANYLHQANTLSTFYQLQTTFCHKKSKIGRSLVLFQEPNKIQQKILHKIKNLHLNFIPNQIIQTYSILKNDQKDHKYQNDKKFIQVALNNKSHMVSQQEYVNLNETLRKYINCDILFIFQKTQNIAAKTFSYYKTIVDGRIKNQQLYEEFFTIYMKVTSKKRQQNSKQGKKDKGDKLSPKQLGLNPIYSITRVCAFNCKGYQNSVYILISKHKLQSSKSLQMFQSHQIKYFKKLQIQKSQMPTNKKLQQNQNVFKIYDIDSITDNFQLQLNFVKDISKSFVKKIKNQYNL